MAVRGRVERRNALAGNLVGDPPSRRAQLSRMAPAPRLVAQRSGRGARTLPADGRLLFQRRKTGAARDPSCLQGLGGESGGVAATGCRLPEGMDAHFIKRDSARRTRNGWLFSGSAFDKMYILDCTCNPMQPKLLSWSGGLRGNLDEPNPTRTGP